ncbi:MAG: DUF3795 domain-containing protein [Spirochaetales bacterium]|nr:DUF3795 domain-containing protein [Spirochaetales bacterium]
MNMQIQDITDCDGCQANERLFSGCSKCEIRKCAINKEMSSCAFCEEYVCDKLTQHFKHDPEAKKRLEKLRESI